MLRYTWAGAPFPFSHGESWPRCFGSVSFLPADTETSFNFHPGSWPAVSKGHLRAAPRRDAWTEAALARMRLGSWPCNTAYVAFIGNTDGFPFGSSLLPRVAYEVQEQGGRSQPAVHPDCQENPVCSVAFSPRRRSYHGALWVFPFCSHSTISKPLHGHWKHCRASFEPCGWVRAPLAGRGTP